MQVRASVYERVCVRVRACGCVHNYVHMCMLACYYGFV